MIRGRRNSFRELIRPKRNTIDWHDVERLEKTNRLKFSCIESFESEILMPYQERQIHKRSSPVGSLRIFDKRIGKYLDKECGSYFFIGPGVAMTAFHIFRDVVDEIRNGDCELHFLCLLGKGRTAIYAGEFITADKNGDVAIVGVTPVRLPNDWLVEQRYFRICSRIPTYGEVVSCIGFRDAQTAKDNQVRSTFHIRDGIVTQTHPEGRDKAILPYPCFLTNLRTLGGMSGGPIFNHQGKCLGVISTGSNPTSAESYTYGASIYPSMIFEFSNSWPPDRTHKKDRLIDSEHIPIEDKHFLHFDEQGRIGSPSIGYKVWPLTPMDSLEIHISS